MNTWEIDTASIDTGERRDRVYLAVNVATREVAAGVVSDLSAPAVICDLLRRIIKTHGVPDAIITDNDPIFLTEKVSQTFKKIGIRHEIRPPFPGAKARMGTAEHHWNAIRFQVSSLKSLREETVAAKHVTERP